MAQILNHKEIKKLLDIVIINGDEACIRPNSYILRLGGEFEFAAGDEAIKMKQGEGILLPAGHTVAVTALEIIDFGKETVQKIYPKCSLHGFLSPTTDFSREGMTVPSTQVDAGYKGTLNWTINNSSPKEARFVYGEKLFRLTILKLEQEEEVPDSHYAGSYQDRAGLVRSERKGAPTGMKERDWHRPISEDSPEKHLEQLIASGYPWNILGKKLKDIDGDFGKMTSEYRDIRESIKNLETELAEMERSLPEKVREFVKDEFKSEREKIIYGLVGLAGLLMSTYGSEKTTNFIMDNMGNIGAFLLVICVVGFLLSFKRKK